MTNKKDIFYFKNDETIKKFSDFKKIKLFEKINDNKNSKGNKVKINKSEKSSTTEEDTNNLEKEEKEKNKLNNEKSNNKDNNNKNINITEDNDSILKQFFPFDIDYIFKDFQEINELEMNSLNKKKCYTLLKLIKKKKYAKNFLKPVLQIVKEKEILDLYKKVIKKPMDLKTIGINLNNDYYKNMGCFLQDYSLIVTNAQNFNQKNSNIFKNAEKIKLFSQKYFKQSFNIEINNQKNKKRILLSPKKDFRKTNNNNKEELLNKKRERKEEDNEILRKNNIINQKEKENNKYEKKKDNFNKDDLVTEEIFLRNKKMKRISFYIGKFSEQQIIKFLTLFKFRNIKDNNCIINNDYSLIKLNNFKDKDLDVVLEICKEIEKEK